MNGGGVLGRLHRFCRLMMHIFNLTQHFCATVCLFLSCESPLCAISFLKFMQNEYKPTTIYADIHYLGLRCVFVLPPPPSPSNLLFHQKDSTRRKITFDLNVASNINTAKISRGERRQIIGGGGEAPVIFLQCLLIQDFTPNVSVNKFYSFHV